MSQDSPARQTPAVPPDYLARMASLLGDEYPDFFACYTQPAVTGLRVNTLKLSASQFQAQSPWQLEPVAWCPNGFTLPGEAGEGTGKKLPGEPVAPGKHPYHAAGLYYLQDPAAMSVAELLAPRPGERVLDLAAAPGGKATHLASSLGNQGVLVANEIHPGRVWDLAQNLERWGARNALVINATPQALSHTWAHCFDLVLVDAPCSGEGLFRKNPAARLEWSKEGVTSNAARQKETLALAARLVKSGGRLGYATCTFAPDENEAVIAHFLATQPEFEMVQLTHPPASQPGRPDWIAPSLNQPGLSSAVRFWPHLAAGEGHFIAVLRRKEDQAIPRPKSDRLHISHQDRALVQEFFADNLRSQLPLENLARYKDHIYRMPAGAPPLANLRVIHPGWWLGTIKSGEFTGRNRFEPAHALAMALRAEQANQVLPLAVEQEEVLIYLQGGTIPSQGSDGWVLVTVAGYPLGWGRRVRGVVKNLYPKGLRVSRMG